MVETAQQLQQQRLAIGASRSRHTALAALAAALFAVAGMAHAAILGIHFGKSQAIKAAMGKAASRLALVLLFAGATVAQATIIGVQSTGSVYSINEATGAATLLSTNLSLFANSMAKNSAGILYAAGGVSSGELKTINPTTGVMTAGPFITGGVGNITGLAFSSGDVLYAIDTVPTGHLYTINVTTGAATLVGNSSPMQALEFSPSGTLYGWSLSVGLVTVNPATGTATDVNPLVGSTASIQTIAFSGAGVAYAASQTDLYTVDLSTGALTLVGSMAPANDIRGMEFIAAAPPAPGVSLTPTPLAFGNQVVTTTSAPQVLTLQNVGTATLNIASIVASGDFAQTNACGATLAPTASCTINVTFTPTVLGARVGAITVTSNAASSPNAVPLSGTGIVAPPGATASLSPPTLAFGNQVVGTTGPAQILTLQNIGGTTLTIASIVASGDFAQTNACAATLAPTASCTVSVTFTPTVLGARSGAITVTSDGVGSPNASTLSGTGAAVPPPLGPSQAIPTLSQWALIGLCVLIGLFAFGTRGAFPRRR